MNQPVRHPPIDFKTVITSNRLLGIWRLMKGYRMRYISANLGQAFSAAFRTSTLLLLRYYVDHILGKPEANGLLPLVGLGFVLFAAGEGGFTYISGRLAAYTAEGVTLRLRNFLFDHIQRLTFSYHSKSKTGELIERVTSDVDALRRFFSEQAIGVGRILMLFLINFIALLDLNVTLAFISVIVVPFVLVTSIYFFRRITKAYEAYQEQEAILTTNLQENLTGVRVVKAFARQDYEKGKFEKQNWQKYVLGRRLLTMHSLFWPVTDILCAFQMLSGFVVAALMAIHGTITVGTYLAYAGLVVWLIWPMRNLGRLIVQTSTGLVSFGRVLEIIKEEREALEEGDHLPANDIRGELLFDNVGFAYEVNEEPVLAEISFHCLPGQTIALLGSTGSGKTSLVNLLPRFYDYTTGRVYLDGVELNRYTRKFLRSQIGIVEQEPFLFSRTIRENITYGVGREVTEREIEAAARAAAIHDVILSFPEGYSTLVGEKGVTLSGGQKQRLTIARTLLKDPRILILDDSTSSVDFETEAEIRLALENLMENRTTFIIAHRVQSVMSADLILVMDRGKIIQKGTHAELLEREGVYRQIYDIQTHIEAELEKEIRQTTAGPIMDGSELPIETLVPGD